MIESQYQSKLKDKIGILFPGAIILKQDSRQGLPDLLILYKNKWATLECKRKHDAPHQPNQDWYVALMNNMSFSRFIFPENEEEVLNELTLFFNGGE
jgi:hypothetical protein